MLNPPTQKPSSRMNFTTLDECRMDTRHRHPLRETLGTSHHVDALRHSQAGTNVETVTPIAKDSHIARSSWPDHPASSLKLIQHKANSVPRFRSTNRHRNSSRNGHLRTDQGAHWKVWCLGIWDASVHGVFDVDAGRAWSGWCCDGLRIVVLTRTLCVGGGFGDFMSIWSQVVVLCDANVDGCRCLACFMLWVAEMVVVIWFEWSEALACDYAVSK